MDNNENSEIISNDNNSIKRNAFFNVLKTLMSMIFPLITFPYASRVLLPEGIGKVNFARSIVQYFIVISLFGVSNYGIREGAKKRENKNELSIFVREMLIINFFTTIFAYSILFIFIKRIDFLSSYSELIYICSITIFLTTFGIEWLFSAVEDFKYISNRYFVFQIISLILLLLFVKNADDILIYSCITVFSTVGANICNLFRARKFINIKAHGKINFKQHLKPMSLMFIMAVMSSIYTMLDTTMLGFYSGDYEVGIYTAASKLNRIVLSLVVAISSVLLPRLSLYKSKKNDEEYSKLVKTGFEVMFLISLPCTLGLSVVSKQIVLLFSGSLFFEAIPVMRILNPIVVIIGISNFIGLQVFLSMGKEKWTFIGGVTAAIVNLVLNFLLIPKFGAVGASIGSLFAEFTVTVVELILLSRLINLRFLIKPFLIYLIDSVVMAFVVYICVNRIESNIVSLITGISIGIIIYVILLFFQKNVLFMEVFNKIIKKKI